MPLNRPFHVFFSTFDFDQVAKFYRHYLKEHLKISKMAKFGSEKLALQTPVQTSVRFPLSYNFPMLKDTTSKRG